MKTQNTAFSHTVFRIQSLQCKAHWLFLSSFDYVYTGFISKIYIIPENNCGKCVSVRS